ncbi:echinoderm microtubule-associated protein-like 2 [Lineus longissimus]|uniref:echinoderm microtubule-associated protein-like 2 n=1 Tax=Lineus longissimus TaxID=88925 RepID=UPI00315C5C5D
MRPSTDGRMLLQEDGPSTDMELELMQQLVNPMQDCSRQRLRAIQMGLRRDGNIESRITSNELKLVFKENGLRLPSRAFQMLVSKYEDNQGIDYEKLWKCLVKTQQNSGRDSVRAMNARNHMDTANAVTVLPDVRDAELIKRLEKQFMKAKFQPELTELRLIFQERDEGKGGQISRHEVVQTCSDFHLPIYGALLNSLLRRCDDEKNGKISWPEMMSFLDKAWQNLVQVNEDAFRSRPRLTPPSRPTSAMRPSSVRPAPRAASTVDGDNVITHPTKTSRQIVQSALQKKGSVSSLASKKGKTETTEGKNTTESSGQIAEDNCRSNSNDNSSYTAFTRKVVPGIDQDDGSSYARAPNADTQNEQDKNRPLLKKSSSGSGFFKSVRSFLSGSKKEDNKAPAIPLIQVDKHTDIKEESAAELTAQNTLVLSPTEKYMKTKIRNKELKLWFPDDFRPGEDHLDPPLERLQLDWVYGYRGHDCRSNIYVMANGEVIYYIANIAVLYDVEGHSQRHYKEHSDEIKSMAVHDDGVTVASGQSAACQKLKYGGAHVRVWRADTLQTLNIIGDDYFEKSIVCLAFPTSKTKAGDESVRYSPGVEDRLVVIDKSKDHLMSVWNVSKAKELARIKIQTDVTCDVDFNPKNPDVIVTIGKEHLVWWRFNAERSLIEVHSRPDYQTHLRAMYVTCLTHNESGDTITGDSNGTIYVWGYPGNNITNMVKHAHNGPVFSLLLYRNALITGGRDHKIKTWLCEKYMDSVGSLEIPPTEGGIRMIQLHKGLLMLGTTANTVLRISINKNGAPLDGAVLERPMTECHFDDLRGLMAFGDVGRPTQFLTAGYDGAICLFDAERKLSLWKVVLKETSALCADVSSDGRVLAIGTRDCALVLLNIPECQKSDEIVDEDASSIRPDIRELTRVKLCNQKPSCVKISPDQKLVAIACYDNIIYIVGQLESSVDEHPEMLEENATIEWAVLRKCKGHVSNINGIDWSIVHPVDQYMLRSSDYGLDTFVWDARTGEQKTNPNETRNISWSTNHCRITYNLAGVWSSKIGKEAEITAVCVSPDKRLVVVGDNRGYIGLLKHPCCNDSPFCHVYRGAVNVQDIRFTQNGKYVLTTGGRDTCVMQWTIV